MAKRRTTTTTTTTTSTGNISTNYGLGKLTDGTNITFLGNVNNGTIDFLNATIQTPLSYLGRKITRTSTTTNVWTLVP